MILKFDPKVPLLKFGVSPDGFQVAMADGTTRYIKLPVKDEVIRPYLSGNNGIPSRLVKAPSAERRRQRLQRTTHQG